jgi:hypothetical protein
MLPESSVIGIASRFTITDISDCVLVGVAIRPGLSKAVTLNGSPNGFPLAGSKPQEVDDGF